MNYKIIKRIIFFIILLQCISCNTSESNTSQERIKTNVSDSNKGNNFNPALIANDTCKNLISCFENKTEMSVNFLKSKTVLDSVYYNEGVTFMGDTIYKLNNKYLAGILNYSDGMVCTYKFILIIDSESNLNTSYLLGATNCDRDGDNEYYYYSYSIINGKIKIIKNRVEKGKEKSNSIIVQSIDYSIDDSGKCVPLR